MPRRKRSPPPESPSELEGCVLGHLWKYGPCTAYSIRKTLLDSPTVAWSGSAGAIYPLLERFQRRRLVASRAAGQDARDARLYALTPAGKEHFLAWLGPPLEGDVVAIAPDPLRTRVHFLGALPPARRKIFLATAGAELKRHLKLLARQPVIDEFDRLSLRGAVAVARARLAWLNGLANSSPRKPVRGIRRSGD